jgi:hypothetical protein
MTMFEKKHKHDILLMLVVNQLVRMKLYVCAARFWFAQSCTKMVLIQEKGIDNPKLKPTHLKHTQTISISYTGHPGKMCLPD